MKHLPPKIITDAERQVVEDGMRKYASVQDYKIDVRGNAIEIHMAHQDSETFREMFTGARPDLDQTQIAAFVAQAVHLSLSRLNHWLPWGQAYPEIVQSTTELHHQVTDTLLPQAHPVFHDATPLDAAVDMLDPEPPLVERLVGQVLRQGPLPTAGLLRRHEDRHLREGEGQEAQILPQPTASRKRVGSGLRNAQIMGTTAVGVAQKEDDAQSIDEQDMLDGVIFFLAALIRGLFRSLLGADNAPFGPVMGTRGASGATTGVGSSSSGVTSVAASASATPSRWARAVSERAGASPRLRRAARSTGKRT